MDLPIYKVSGKTFLLALLQTSRRFDRAARDREERVLPPKVFISPKRTSYSKRTLLRPTLTRSERKAAHALAEAAGLNHASSAVISGDGGSGSSGKAPRQLKIWWKDSATGPVVLDAFADVPRQLPARDTAAAVTADAAAAAARAPELSTRGGAHWVVWAARVAAVWISGYNICSRRGRLDHAVLASAALGTLCHSTFVRPRPRAFDEVNSPLRLLRKAETVLNARSSQLLVVIERSYIYLV